MCQKQTNSEHNKTRKIGLEGPYILLWSKRIHLTYVVLLTIAIYFLVHSFGVTVENREIRKNGLKTIGVVYEIKKVGGKGIMRCYYNFNLGLNQYKGQTDNDYLKIGDTIGILYLLEKPEKNRAESFFRN